MNSYPPELTHHAYASLFVAGLTKPQQAGPSSSSSSAAAPAPAANGDGAAASTSQLQLNGHPTEVYPELCAELETVFSSRGKHTIWDPARGRSAVFHSVLVDHNVRLPPRKTRPSLRSVAAPEPSANPPILHPRSPLSPLHPASPLFPDGLIAPIWARKHRDIVPSVFVAFYCLSGDAAVEQTSEDNDAPSPAPRQLSGQELKARDEELIRLISERKRPLNERGIKLTVVLLTARNMLDNPQLEARLSYIRRSSGLDSKASLFVLTPVQRQELADFVTSLQGALYDHGLDYYREHARRIRRKRARYPPPPSIVQPILQSVAASRPNSKAPELTPLSREGWHLRAEYKLAMFAELHADYDDALAHYLEAYDLLAGPRGMLSSTVLLPPRTKRWAEAKVLSDTLSLRISKLYLYGEDSASALHQFRRHLARFSELSSGWGIGDATFEYWSWLGKQYRLIGALLEQAMKSYPGSPLPPISIPMHNPPLPGFLLHPEITEQPQRYPSLRAAPGGLLSPNNAALSSATTPAALLQGPAAFFYNAGLCALERQDRYVKMVAAETKGEVSESGATALVHEKQVDHCAQIVEVLGRAHDLYREAKQERLADVVAAKMARAWATDGHWKQALRMLHRVIPRYRDEGPSVGLKELLLLAVHCAEKAGDKRAQAQWTLEASGEQELSNEEWEMMEKGWKELSLGVEDSETVSVSWSKGRGPLRVDVAFQRASVQYGGAASFQLTVTRAQQSPPLAFESMTIFDLAGKVVAVVEANGAAASSSSPIQLKPPSERTQAKISWLSEEQLSSVFQGTLKATSKSSLAISRVHFHASSPLPLDIEVKIDSPSTTLPHAPLWLCSSGRWVHLVYRQEARHCLVTRPVHRVDVEIDHHVTAYLDEAVSIRVKATNKEQSPLRCALAVSLDTSNLPPDVRDELGQQGLQPTLSGSLPNLALGVLAPQESKDVTLVLRAKQRTGLRSLAMVLKSCMTDVAHDEDEDVDGALAGELVRETTIGIQRAFRAEYSANWRPGAAATAANGNDAQQLLLGDGAGAPGASFDTMPRSPGAGPPSEQHRTAIASVHAAFAVLTAEELTISDVKVELDEEHGKDARPYGGGDAAVAAELESVRQSSLAGKWRQGDRWGSTWDIEVGLGAYESEDGPRGPTGQLALTWQRASSSDPRPNITRLPLPILAPPHLNARVLIAAPPATHALEAFTLVFVVVNPSSHAVDVSMVIDDEDPPAWVLGHRTLSIPGIPPRGSRSIPTRIVPRYEGQWTLPRVRAFQHRPQEEMAEGQQGQGHQMVINETQYGLPLQVRYRVSAGATMGAAGQRALAVNRQHVVEQEGATLSVLVLPQQGAARSSSDMGIGGASGGAGAGVAVGQA
ncbi:hypothetical protein BDZ90DRAFT_257681 [Jaminaea rosea]|uniref:Trafficking protein particle complex subunit 11 domain-containing protein n=1 Tax=Jaminaea rosea TaxID=1569628 RepID=A0A316UZA1_9BASI|nr:hypothetical protein BDZ90DRAFT_257681 [Jaminaea rosea]PWN30606.1 hypothetical protein BDZ90DRAFT_257681 [Jaminaea rosea]